MHIKNHVCKLISSWFLDSFQLKWASSWCKIKTTSTGRIIVAKCPKGYRFRTEPGSRELRRQRPHAGCLASFCHKYWLLNTAAHNDWPRLLGVGRCGLQECSVEHGVPRIATHTRNTGGRGLRETRRKGRREESRSDTGEGRVGGPVLEVGFNTGTTPVP